ncbi:glucose-specific phosphotransferase enzyme IIA component [Fusobacterium gonidiaformans 3-1-5R]|uniref:Glucose-specific phosphotransferase enzyme IIA component n=2 Tax=Fusobacterium TaxID=848 RepID=E5BFZ5_9FUSO|nr:MULTISPECIES: PTS glucose transporter subunit IIA [Fusobacterium]AVQ17138.1 PTS sugar transporter subunit IIA [Fusobacterium gonidiaformans ATCC 25563]EFS21026.1 glucose-specific phosphotransferase enzyme IIA component [Fusobacterium gonidiaformans 3-1-5R]EFS29068.1 PTS system, glucose subfamily, IIA component [Fusobacterium gonidiaformans ATCC 25563]KXA16115.1 putative glucose-specific phosphotransferase enzyme IIA component [Fusobacterium equinum]
MGLFNNLFGKKEEKKVVTIYAPVNGTVIDLAEIPDPAFAEKMVGDGCGMEPKEGAICSPVNGEIANIFDTRHAVSFDSEDGLEMIVHFGIDTVKLKGEGFKALRGEGETKVGDAIVEYDLAYIAANAPSTRTPVIINNMEEVEKIEVIALGKEVKAGDPIMKVTLK